MQETAKKNNNGVIIGLIIIAILIAVVPFLVIGGKAEFGGSDDAGSEMVAEITGRTLRICSTHFYQWRNSCIWKPFVRIWRYNKTFDMD